FALEQSRDPHSAFREPAQAKQAQQGVNRGLGMALADRQIADIFPGGAADKAGVRVGDVLEAANGEPFESVSSDRRISVFQSGAVSLTLRRTGQSQLLTVSLQPTPLDYDRYRRPSGHRLENDIGYVELS